VSGASSYPGAVVLSWLPCRRQPALPPPSGGPTPQTHIPPPGLRLTGLTKVHHVHPPGLPLSCCQWMDHRPLEFLPVLHTPRRSPPWRMPRAGTGVEHSPGLSGHTSLHPSSSLEKVRPRCRGGKVGWLILAAGQQTSGRLSGLSTLAVLMIWQRLALVATRRRRGGRPCGCTASRTAVRPRPLLQSRPAADIHPRRPAPDRVVGMTGRASPALRQRRSTLRGGRFWSA